MHKIVNSVTATVFLILGLFASPVAGMVMPGQVDNFEDGTLQNWQAGGLVNPNRPTNVVNGGPMGSGDNFMRLTSNGSFGAGGKLVVFNTSQWSGNYLTADIASIQMQVNNTGSTSLVLRLIFDDKDHGQTLTTKAPINVAPGTGWTTISFPLDSANLMGGTFNTVMASVTEFNLVHSPNIIPTRSVAPNISAQLGVDNITAVPRMALIPTWIVNADGNWSTAGNWSGGVPNATGAQAVLGSIITQPRTVTVDTPITVGRLDLDNTNAYTIAGSGALTLNATSGDAQINVPRGSHTISAPLALADNTVVTVTPAASNLSITGAVTGTSASLTKAGAGTLTVNQLRATGLTINAGKVVVASDGTPDTPVVGSLSIAGGAAPTATFDLTNNAAVVDYTGASPVATVRQQILAGRGAPGFGAPWTGMGITSSTVATVNVAESESRSVAYAENAGLPLGAYTNFRGQPVDATSILMVYTRTGDANLDGLVNDDDVTILGATYAPGVPQPDWTLGDFDYNGFVDDDDVTLMGVFYDPTAAPLLAPPNTAPATLAAVPEPATVGMLGAMAGTLILVALRRRQRAAERSSRHAI
ncbi:MAG: PEP-CTERM sorting domain-containing protein [Pirellulales bacterium]